MLPFFFSSIWRVSDGRKKRRESRGACVRGSLHIIYQVLWGNALPHTSIIYIALLRMSVFVMRSNGAQANTSLPVHEDRNSSAQDFRSMLIIILLLWFLRGFCFFSSNFLGKKVAIFASLYIFSTKTKKINGVTFIRSIDLSRLKLISRDRQETRGAEQGGGG